MKPPTSSEHVPTKVRKTLLQQQTEYTIRDPSTHAARQVRDLDTFAGSLAAKKKACRDQIDRDRQELAYIDLKINSEAKKYDALLENLNARRAERDRMSQHLARYKDESSSLVAAASSSTSRVRREDSRMLKSVSSMELEAARGFGSGPGTTFSRKRRAGSSGGAGGGSAQSLPPLGGGRSGSMNHSISAPALRR